MQRKDATATAPSQTRRIALAAVVALGATFGTSTAAQAAIEVDHGIEFVNIAGVAPPGTPLRLTVTDPDGNALGVKRFAGDIELNHDGPPCFDGESTPDLRPGDTLTVSEDVVGGDVLETHTIADVTYASRFDAANPGDPTTTPPVPATPNTLVISGSVPAGSDTEVRLGGSFPANVDVTGGTLDESRQDLDRRLLIAPDGDNFVVSISPLTEANVAEIIVGVGADGGNITMFSGEAGAAPLGCPLLDAGRGPITLPELPPVPVPPGDADGDGVTNDRDGCPNVVGPFNNDGCPVPVAPPVRLAGSVVTNTAFQPGPAAAVAGVKASPKLALGRLTMRSALTRRAVRANGLSPLMVLKPDTKVLSIRIYRKNADGTRTLVAVRFVSTAAVGSYRARLKDSKLRAALTPGRYEAQVTPGRTRSSLGTTSKFAFRVTP